MFKLTIQGTLECSMKLLYSGTHAREGCASGVWAKCMYSASVGR